MIINYILFVKLCLQSADTETVSQKKELTWTYIYKKTKYTSVSAPAAMNLQLKQDLARA